MPEKPILFVDLDGTLVGTDTTLAAIFALIGRPLRLLSGLLALRFGKAAMKQRIAAAAPLDAASLPYNEELVSLLRREAAGGRSLVLATGADRRVAAAVADHLGLFEAVLASDGAVNLTGRAKLEAIRRMVGDRPFAYAGNERKDLAIWPEAESAILVNVSGSLLRATSAATRIEMVLGLKSGRTAALVRAAKAALRAGAMARRAGIGRGRTAMSASAYRRSARRDR